MKKAIFLIAIGLILLTAFLLINRLNERERGRENNGESPRVDIKTRPRYSSKTPSRNEHVITAGESAARDENDDLSAEDVDSGIIAGRVSDEASDLAVVDAVVVMRNTDLTTWKTRTDASGRFDQKGLPSGKYSIVAAAKDCLSDVRIVEIKNGEHARIELYTKNLSEVSVTVVSEETGQAIPSAVVSARSRDTKSMLGLTTLTEWDTPGGSRAVITDSGREDRTKPTIHFTTGSDGTVAFRTAKGPNYLLKVDALGYSPVSKAIRMKEGRNALTFRLEKLALISGRVVNSSGSPVSGAEFYIRGDVRDYTGEEKMRSRKDGSFSLELFRAETCAVGATHGRYAPGISKTFQVKEKQEIKGVVVVLSKGGSVSGKVLDENNNPVEGIVIDCIYDESPDEGILRPYGARTVLTNRNGEYTIRNLYPAKYEVRALSSRYLEESVKGITVDEGTVITGIDFKLDPGLEVTGTVVGTDGQPIEEAGVMAQLASGRGLLCDPGIITDHSGEFRITGLLSRKYKLQCEKEGYVLSVVPVEPPEAGVKIVIKKGGILKGTVVSEDGEMPLQDYNITCNVSVPYAQPKYTDVFPSEGKLDNKYAFEGQADGSFEIPGLGAGEYTIIIKSSEYASSIINATILPEKVTDLGTIKMNQGVTLRIRVVTREEEKPIENADISLYYDLGSWEDPYSQHARTDVGGECILRKVPAGSPALYVTHPSFIDRQVEVALDAPEDKELTIELDPGLNINGIVLSQNEQTPITGAQVSLCKHGADDDEASYTESDKEGRFSFNMEQPGKYILEIEHRDFALLVDEDFVLPRDDEEDTFLLSGGGGVKFHVLDSANQPAEGWQVDIVGKYSYILGGITDDDGEYTIPHVPEGKWTARVLLPEPRRSERLPLLREVDVVEGQTTEVEFVIDTGFTISGLVTYGKMPLDDVSVNILPARLLVRDEPGSDNAFTSTNAQGRFEFKDLNPGEYLIWVEDFSDLEQTKMTTKRVIVIDKDVDIEIALAGGSIGGIVLDDEGNPVPGAAVLLYPELRGREAYQYISLYRFLGGAYRSTSTDTDGRYTFESVGKGRFRIIADKEGCSYAHTTIRKEEEDHAKQANLTLAQGSSIVGRIETVDGLRPDKVFLIALDDKGRPVKFAFPSIDDQRHYVFKGVPQGDFQIVALADGYAVARQNVNVSSDLVKDVDFTLPAGHTLTISVRGRNGNPVENAVPYFEEKDPVASYFLNSRVFFGFDDTATPSNKDGRLTIRNLSSGTHNITINGSGYQTKKLTVNIAGQDKSIEVVLENE